MVLLVEKFIVDTYGGHGAHGGGNSGKNIIKIALG